MKGARPSLLLVLARADDPMRLATGPALAAAAERAGWAFECYYDAPRRGRHFGSGDPADAPPGDAQGGLVAGGGHVERLLWLARAYEIAALGDPGALLWPALRGAGVTALARTDDPAELYAAALERLGLDVPDWALVLDGRAQGPADVVTGAYLYPALLAGPPALALEAGCGAEARSALARLGVREFHGLGLEPERAAAFPGGLDSDERLDVTAGYAAFTSGLAERFAAWGRGLLLGDPELVAAQLPKARRLRLVALHGRPQVDVVRRAAARVASAREPVFGRQWDDRDFFALAEAGRGLQVLDPAPPFDAARALAELAPLPDPPASPEPDDEQLRRWAQEGRVLATLLLWSGMLRELDCLPRLIDLVAATGLRAGLVITAETVEHAGGGLLGLLATPVERGGVLGHLELVLGSTGRGVAAEAHLRPQSLTESLAEARSAIAALLPEPMVPEGWWPLLDSRLVARRELPLERRRGALPAVRLAPRARPQGGALASDASSAEPPPPRRADARALVGAAVRRAGLGAMLDERRPFDGQRPGPFVPAVAEAVRASGLRYMWTKTGFGRPQPQFLPGGFVALPFTAGNWDGWSPFYTVGSAADVRRAERGLLRARRAGWLASTVDSPLFALSGEIWERGGQLHEIARLLAAGGGSGELINVVPRTVARYARVVADLESEATGGRRGSRPRRARSPDR